MSCSEPGQDDDLELETLRLRVGPDLHRRFSQAPISRERYAGNAAVGEGRGPAVGLCLRRQEHGDVSEGDRLMRVGAGDEPDHSVGLGACVHAPFHERSAARSDRHGCLFTAAELLIEIRDLLVAERRKGGLDDLAGVAVVDAQHRGPPPDLDARLAEREPTCVNPLGPVSGQEEPIRPIGSAAVGQGAEEVEAHHGQVLCLVDHHAAVGPGAVAPHGGERPDRDVGPRGRAAARHGLVPLLGDRPDLLPCGPGEALPTTDPYDRAVLLEVREAPALDDSLDLGTDVGGREAHLHHGAARCVGSTPGQVECLVDGGRRHDRCGALVPFDDGTRQAVDVSELDVGRGARQSSIQRLEHRPQTGDHCREEDRGFRVDLLVPVPSGELGRPVEGDDGLASAGRAAHPGWPAGR